MSEHVPEHILSAVLELSVACKGGKSDHATAAVFAKYLSDLTPEAVSLAVTRWCLAQTFFPTPSELRALVNTPCGLNASTAWEEACAAVSEHGYYGSPRWSHPAIERAVMATCGSWEDFCTSPSDQFAAKRAKFFQVFDGLLESVRARGNEIVAREMLRLPRQGEGPTRIADLLAAPEPDQETKGWW